jgi:hypothetical protein
MEGREMCLERESLEGTGDGQETWNPPVGVQTILGRLQLVV